MSGESSRPSRPAADQPATESAPVNTMRPLQGDAAAPAATPSSSKPTGSGPAVSPLSRANAAVPAIPDDRPELKVAAAFGGGFVLALLLKRLAR
jgi:hypothetical protein